MGDSGSFSFIKDMYIEHRLSPAPVYAARRSVEATVQPPGDGLGLRERVQRALDRERARRWWPRPRHRAAQRLREVAPRASSGSSACSTRSAAAADRPTIPVTCTTDAGDGQRHVRRTVARRPSPRTSVRRSSRAPAGTRRSAKGYSEVDLEGGPLRYSVAAAYKIDLANFAKHGQPSLADNLSHGLEVDWNIKANGLSFSGGVVMMKLKTADAQYGFVIQPGFMVVPKHVELAARFALTTEPRTIATRSKRSARSTTSCTDIA